MGVGGWGGGGYNWFHVLCSTVKKQKPDWGILRTFLRSSISPAEIVVVVKVCDVEGPDGGVDEGDPDLDFRFGFRGADRRQELRLVKTGLRSSPGRGDLTNFALDNWNEYLANFESWLKKANSKTIWTHSWLFFFSLNMTTVDYR